tara:strand:- start:518 stop:694 length:177 start_codon:yes stop_codon:yes gene_type:complete
MKKLSGAKRARTADPLHAMQVLYQLSYGPNKKNNTISFIILINKTCKNLRIQSTLTKT